MVSLVPRRFRLGHSWTLPWAVTSPRDTRRVRWFLGVADTNDVIQTIEKTLNNTNTTTQKLTNNSFRNTKKHPRVLSPALSQTSGGQRIKRERVGTRLGYGHSRLLFSPLLIWYFKEWYYIAEFVLKNMANQKWTNMTFSRHFQLKRKTPVKIFLQPWSQSSLLRGSSNWDSPGNEVSLTLVLKCP